MAIWYYPKGDIDPGGHGTVLVVELGGGRYLNVRADGKVFFDMYFPGQGYAGWKWI